MFHQHSFRSLCCPACAVIAMVLVAPGCGGSDDPGQDDTSIPVDDASDTSGDTDTADAPDTDAAPDLPSDTVDAPDDDTSADVPDQDTVDADVDTADADVVEPPPEVLLPVDMALEPGGDTALVSTMDGFVVRVDVTTRLITGVVASGLMGPAGIAIEDGGEQVLVVERDAGRLVRLSTTTGAATTVADGLDYPQGVAILPGGAEVLVSEGGGLRRVTLADGVRDFVTTLVLYGRDVVIEDGGTTALVLEPGQISRVEFDSGTASPVVTEQVIGQGTFRGALALASDGGSALVNTDIGCLVRIDLEAGTGARVGCLFENDQMALVFEPGDEWALLGTDSQLMRVRLEPELDRVLDSNSGIEWIVVEDGGTSALVLSSAPLVEDPRLRRLDLAGGGLSAVSTLSGFLGASGLVVEAGGGSVLTLGQGIVDNGGVTALLRVDLGTGEVTEITRNLDQCSGSDVAIAEDGAVALIPCTSRVYRVVLATGEVSVIAAGTDPGGIALSSDGTWALYSTMSGRELWRVEIPEGGPERVGGNLFGSTPPGAGCTDVVIEADERSALVTQTGLYGGPYASTGRVVRVDLESGAVTVLVAGGLDAPGTFSCGTVGLAIEPGGASALVAEYHRGVTRIGLPTR